MNKSRTGAQNWIRRTAGKGAQLEKALQAYGLRLCVSALVGWPVYVLHRMGLACSLGLQKKRVKTLYEGMQCM